MTLATSKSGIDTVVEQGNAGEKQCPNSDTHANFTYKYQCALVLETKHSFVSLLQIWITKAMIVNSDVSYNESFIWQGFTVKKNYKR